MSDCSSSSNNSTRGCSSSCSIRASSSCDGRGAAVTRVSVRIIAGPRSGLARAEFWLLQRDRRPAAVRTTKRSGEHADDVTDDGQRVGEVENRGRSRPDQQRTEILGGGGEAMRHFLETRGGGG